MGHLGWPNIVASSHHARLVPGAWCLVPGAWCLVPGACWVIWVMGFYVAQMTQG